MQHQDANIGQQIHDFARVLFPICRSLTGDGVRKSLQIFKQMLPGLQVHEVPSGIKAFDWTVPPEWNIRDAYLLGPNGRKVVDFQRHNLHVVGYSEPVNKELTLSELQRHLHSLPGQPDAIPYVTSYYVRRWGFCLTHLQREALPDGTYRAVIDSTLEPGTLTYADLVVPGETSMEVLISSNICHPSLAKDDLSGPVVAAFLARWVSGLPKRRLSYRFVWIPETIGAIVYLSRHLENLQKNIVAGYTVSNVGDDRAYSLVPSRAGNTLSDRAARHVLRHTAPAFKHYTFLDRGTDERQYCAPGVDLPIASVMRSRGGSFPEYHTSLDDLTFVTATGFQGGYTALRRCLEVLDGECRYRVKVLGEPQMGKRGLYTTLGTTDVGEAVRTRMNILTYCDGKHSTLDIAEILGKPAWVLAPYFAELLQHDLIGEVT